MSPGATAAISPDELFDIAPGAPRAPSPSIAADVASGIYRAATRPIRLVPGGSAAWAPDGGAVIELSIDVDGVAPLMRVSGVIPLASSLGAPPPRFLGTLIDRGSATWSGASWRLYRSSDGGIAGVETIDLALRGTEAILRLGNGDASSPAIRLRRSTPWFRCVEIEIDREADVSAEASYDTSRNSDRPADWKDQVLDLRSAYARAGVEVRLTDAGALVPQFAAGSAPEPTWCDMELHDAMARYWSQADLGPGFRMWLLCAGLHDEGEALGGVMFDGDSSPDAPQRQGAAVFVRAWMHKVGGNAWNAATPESAQRQLFFNLMHESGHAFNLAHSWQKSLAAGSIPGSGPWLPMDDRPDARSWMNYPFNISGFWWDFPFNFDEGELLFLRHAPLELAMMGGRAFFVDHGAQQEAGMPGLRLALHPREGYDYLEPVRVAARLENVGDDPVEVPDRFELGSTLTVVVEGGGRRFVVRPYVRASVVPRTRRLRKGEFVSFDVYIGGSPRVGSHFLEPDRYKLQVLFHDERRRLAASPVTEVEVRDPASFEVYRLRRVVGGMEGSRVFRFLGSHVLERGRRGIEQLAATLDRSDPGSDAARHAALVLGNPFGRTRRVPGAKRGELRAIAADAKIAGLAYERFLQLGDAGMASRAASQNGPFYGQVAARYLVALASANRLDDARAALKRATTALQKAQIGADILKSLEQKLLDLERRQPPP